MPLIYTVCIYCIYICVGVCLHSDSWVPSCFPKRTCHRMTPLLGPDFVAAAALSNLFMEIAQSEVARCSAVFRYLSVYIYIYNTHAHTHIHTHIYIYMYIKPKLSEDDECCWMAGGISQEVRKLRN